MAQSTTFDRLRSPNSLTNDGSFSQATIDQTVGQVYHPQAVVEPEEVAEMAQLPGELNGAVPAKPVFNQAAMAPATAHKPSSAPLANGSNGTAVPPTNGVSPEENTKSHLWIVLLILLVAGVLAALIYAAASDLAELSKRQKQLEAQLAANKPDQDLQLAVDQLAVKVANLQGTGGAGGTQGSDGAAGPTGPAGKDGTPGATGAAGATGATGPQGPAGVGTCANGDCVSLQAATPGVQETGNINISGTMIAGNFSGSGSSLTSLNASNISSGTLADARLSTNVTLQGNAFNGASQLVQTTAGGALPAISGANLTSLNASNISSGTLADARLSANVSLLGSSIQDAEVDDDLTISATGSVDWLALTNYPAGCGAGQAVVTIGDTLTCAAFASDSGSANYIQNQSAADQAADFRISGTGRAGALQAPTLDTATAAALGIGNTNATSVTVCNSAACDTVDIATNADADAVNIGDALDTLTLTGNSSSTLVINGVTISAAELALLDGHDVALVDTNDAVATAIIGTGALNSGSITSGFGSINIGTDTITSGAITTSGTLTFNGVATDITTGTNEDLVIDPNGDGDVMFNLGSEQSVRINATAAPGGTMTYITNGGFPATEPGASALGIEFYQGADADGDGNWALASDAYTTASHADDFFTAGYFTLNNSSTAGTQQGLFVVNADTDENPTTEALLALRNDETTASTVTDGLIISGTAGAGTDTIVDGVDVSDDNIQNAINIGANNILTSGATISASELNLLDGHDVALVDTNDAVATAIIGTGALNSGSITSGFGAIDVGADDITTTGTVYGNNFDRSAAGALGIGNTNATSVSICNSAACDTVSIATNADADTITIGNTNTTTALTLQGGTGGVVLQSQGGTLGVGNNAVAQSLSIGNATGTTAVNVDCGTGACNFGTTATSHTTTLGSTSGTSATTVQSGTGGVTINSTSSDVTIQSTTSGAINLKPAGSSNVVIGTSDTTGTLLVLDEKTDSGDPTGVAGGSYYNSSGSDKFRCYENGGWHDCAGGTLGYAEKTANQTGITSETDLTNLSITVTVPANHRIRIRGHVLGTMDTNAQAAKVTIKESTTQLSECHYYIPNLFFPASPECSVILTPSSGSHTYKLALARTSGSGTAGINCAATYPCYILVEDIGQ